MNTIDNILAWEMLILNMNFLIWLSGEITD